MKSWGPPARLFTSELLCLPCPASSPDPPPGAGLRVTCPLSWRLLGLSAPPWTPRGAPRPHGPGPTGRLPLEVKPTRIRSLANSVTCLLSFPSCSLALPHAHRTPQSRYSRPPATSPYTDHLPYPLRVTAFCGPPSPVKNNTDTAPESNSHATCLPPAKRRSSAALTR